MEHFTITIYISMSFYGDLIIWSAIVLVLNWGFKLNCANSTSILNSDAFYFVDVCKCHQLRVNVVKAKAV